MSPHVSSLRAALRSAECKPSAAKPKAAASGLGTLRFTRYTGMFLLQKLLTGVADVLAADINDAGITSAESQRRCDWRCVMNPAALRWTQHLLEPRDRLGTDLGQTWDSTGVLRVGLDYRLVIKVLIFSLIVLHLSILIALRVALQPLIISYFNSICSKEHDRNEKLLVRRPRLRKRQRSQATVSPSQQETGGPPGGSKKSRKPRKLIHDAAHL